MKLYNQWIEALDNYKPACGTLRGASDQFCCLGVLCDLSDTGEWVETDDNRLAYADGTDSIPESTALPASVQNIVGLRTFDGRFDCNELSTSLQNEIREYVHLSMIDNGYIELATINDEILSFDANPFPIIKKILIERPPSLFVEQDRN